MIIENLVGGTGTIAKEATQTIHSLIKGWKWLYETEVWVGIPEEKSGRGGPLSNAQLMFLHTNGVPSHNIPARPVIEPALSEEETNDRIVEYLGDGMRAALKGDIASAVTCYERAGMIGENAVKEYFTSGNLAPNAPSTIARKGKKSQPLIDTGALRASIAYVIKKK